MQRVWRISVNVTWPGRIVLVGLLPLPPRWPQRSRASVLAWHGSDRAIARTAVPSFTESMNEDEDRAVAEVAERLLKRFPLEPPDVVKATVAEFHQQYDGCRIRDYIPVLVEREARDRLSPVSRTTVDAVSSS